ncbi:uncharacterized protein M421DRAFT_88 [Didymella exigua CBS 183.55]|uniref:Uncharacterized protein n=1 Tax=Didymella exigua CBS 183.55 TaxID=1150837 RepID=A0A6A5S391_9PLEO|nr:uncharacterized protein M421DRAFT_88 [Didymella exigua CBS 183.55]KAF1933904.1 hypothetical protein M421DRAFT_88 [Didymella exigua CBS 183.55]
MDDTHHPDGPTPKKPRRSSFTCSTKTCAVQHYPQNTMKQSQILTPPLTPPHSPRSSTSTPARKLPRKEDRTTSKVHFGLHTSMPASNLTTGLTSNLTTGLTSNLTTGLTSNLTTDLTTDLTSNLTTDLTSNLTTDLTTRAACTSEPSLWPLRGSCFEPETSAATPPRLASAENRWSRLLERAASSNRDRHRARLEGDGWAFVAGRYSDELHELSDESAESLDDEFDVVVLARESLGC